MAEYVPTTEEIINGYAKANCGDGSHGDIEEAEMENRFDALRWLREHDRTERAAALREAVEEMGHADHCYPDPNRDPYVGCACRLTFLLAIADRIERGA